MLSALIKILRITLVLTTLAIPAMAQSYYEPARGTQERKDLLNAVRPLAEFSFDGSVEFVIHSLNVFGDVAYFELSPQRPGGAPIVRPNGHFYSIYDVGLNNGVSGFAMRWNGKWEVMGFVVGATEAWFWDGAYCRDFYEVIPNSCPSR